MSMYNIVCTSHVHVLVNQLDLYFMDNPFGAYI